MVGSRLSILRDKSNNREVKNVMGGFLSKEAGRLAGGVPQRTLQSWTEKGLIIPSIKDTSGTGNRRLYGPENIKEISAYRVFLEGQKKARKEYEAGMKQRVNIRRV